MAPPKLVRLKPYNPKRGYTCRCYIYRGLKIEEGKGFYKVDAATAEYLDNQHYFDDPVAPKKFDVCTQAEALAIWEAEKNKAEIKNRINETRPPESEAEDETDPVVPPKRTPASARRPPAVLTEKRVPEKSPEPDEDPFGASADPE